jgi:uncharacterized protein (TIGR03118 family)
MTQFRDYGVDSVPCRAYTRQDSRQPGIKEDNMKKTYLLGAALLLCAGAEAQTNSYSSFNIVTNSQDSHLINPWGISRAASKSVAENEWWVSDNVTGLSTLYDADGTIAGLTVKIPPAGTTGVGSPTGTAAYSIGSSNVNFAFATLDGTISYWNSQTPPTKKGSSCAACHISTATIMVNNAASGASYQGLTIAKNAISGAETFYAANANGGIEAYDAASFAPVTLPPGAFTDSKIPNTYSPAGIQAIGSKIYVTYNAIAGGGTGYVDAYNTNGKLMLRIGTTEWFNQPWGVALAPANFGAFSNMILVGNTGSGWIGAYNATNGTFQGFLDNTGGSELTIPGLWGLSFGNGSSETGPTTTLYFAAGGPNLTAGTFGAITAN